jgi:hypothetical protein
MARTACGYVNIYMARYFSLFLAFDLHVITINIAEFYVRYRKLILTGVQQTARNVKIWRSRMTNEYILNS